MSRILSPENVIEEARTWIGTPWHHDANLKGVGVDCSNLLMEVSKVFGVPIQYPGTYTTGDEYERMVSQMELYCNEIMDTDAIRTHQMANGLDMVSFLHKADILVFRDNRMFNHCSFYSGESNDPNPTHIHAYNSASFSAVIEDPIDRNWWKRLANIFRYKELS